MSNKVQSLGSIGSAAAGITCSGGTNATPIVATFNAGHGLKSGDRVAIAGVTGNTAMNGIWTVEFTGANTARLLGSAGNGTFGGTVRVGVVMDVTPFMAGHPVSMVFDGAAAVATFNLEAYANYADFAAGNNATGGQTFPVRDPAWTNTNGDASTTPARSQLANPSATVEVGLARIMRAVASAYTSGTILPRLVG